MSWDQFRQFIILPFTAPFFAAFMIFIALVAPWGELDFANPVSFVFPTLIIATLSAIAIRHVVKPHTEGWIVFAKRLLFCITVSAPILYLDAIYLLSYRGWQILGHEPLYMIDDPKYIGPDDTTYQMLYSVVGYGYAGTGWLLYTSFGLLAHLWRHLTRKEVKWYFVFLLTAWILSVLSDRVAWFLD